MRKYHFYKQHDRSDCGATCLRIVCRYYGMMKLQLGNHVPTRGEILLDGHRKQRILLARAVYHAPYYVFLDEATNALDSHTEAEVIRGMSKGYCGEKRTMVMIAHRLSTIRCADFIVVMENGQLVEQGTHEELLIRKGAYLRLVKNQLSAS